MPFTPQFPLGCNPASNSEGGESLVVNIHERQVNAFISTPTLKCVHKRVNLTIDSQSGDLHSSPTELRTDWPLTVNHGTADQLHNRSALQRRGRITHPLFHHLASQVFISVYNAWSAAVVIESRKGEKMTHHALELASYKTTDDIVTWTPESRTRSKTMPPISIYGTAYDPFPNGDDGKENPRSVRLLSPN